MNKDNLLFATLGLLFGFIAGYVLHEVMAARQPPRRLAGDAAQVAAQPAGAGAAAGEQVGPEASPSGGAASAASAAGAAPSPEAAMQGIQRLREYVASHPGDAAAVLKLGNLNAEIGNWQRARDLYQQYLKLKPDDAEVMVDLGISYRGMKQYDQAIDLFHQAEQKAPSIWQAFFYEVVVLGFDLNRYDAAAGVLAQLQKMQPANPDVAQLAAELNRRRGAS